MTTVFTTEIGIKNAQPVVFGHGWGRDHRDFAPIAELVAHQARIILLDFPGFGRSPRPNQAWGTAQYAEAVQSHLAQELGITQYIWVGHSFGARVGLRLAALPNSPLTALLVVAGAGIIRPRPLHHRVHSQWKSWVFQWKKRRAAGNPEALRLLEKQYGSPDYIASEQLGLRDIFLQVVNEDQSDSLSAIQCPTTLVYGQQDGETPPAIGHRLQQLIAGSCLIECPQWDHHSILTRGRHQIATLLLEHLAQGAA